jgi:hypothetical protein
LWDLCTKNASYILYKDDGKVVSVLSSIYIALVDIWFVGSAKACQENFISLRISRRENNCTLRRNGNVSILRLVVSFCFRWIGHYVGKTILKSAGNQDLIVLSSRLYQFATITAFMWLLITVYE